MKIQPVIEKIANSQKYKEFIQKNKDAFLIAGFFIMDYETKQNIQTIDYYIPSEKKVAAFTMSEPVTIQTMQLLDEKQPEKLSSDINVDLDELYGILEDEMKNRSITEDIKKMIAVISNVEGKKVWNVNCILSGMEILKAHVDDGSKTVLRMDKVLMTEIMKRMPAGVAMPQAQSNQEAKAGRQKKSKNQIKEEIKKLDIIEKEIEKEKKALKAAEKNSKKEKAEEEADEDDSEFPSMPADSEE